MRTKTMMYILLEGTMPQSYELRPVHAVTEEEVDCIHFSDPQYGLYSLLLGRCAPTPSWN